MGMPADRFISHGSRAAQLAECGLDAANVAATIQRLLEKDLPSPRVAARSKSVPANI
jgi:deoxyxylulose-5-phosphate synthase